MTQQVDERPVSSCSSMDAHGPHGWVLHSLDYWCTGIQPCSMTAPHVAHRWDPVSRRNRCPGVPHHDDKWRYAEDLARSMNI